MILSKTKYQTPEFNNNINLIKIFFDKKKDVKKMRFV